MDSSLFQSLFTFMNNHIFTIIYLFVALEIYLVMSVFWMMRKHQSTLEDAMDNLMKGFEDAPDKDSTLHSHEKIQSALQFVTNKIAHEPQTKAHFSKNAKRVNERAMFDRHYKLEIFASVMGTVVQVFPLLGILGTILAIAQTAFSGAGQIDVQGLSNAFVIAMDTTILGITFAVIFMVVESSFQPKIDRVINESEEYRKIISNIYLS